MEKIDNTNQNSNPSDLSDHDLMVNHVYQDDVELLYLDCCFSELLHQ